MSLTLKPVNVWALVLLVLALLSAGSFIVHGIRLGLPPMFIVGVAGTIFNVVLLVYSLLGPLYSDRELRYALFSIVFCNCFFIVGAFAIAYNRSMISTLALIAGVTVYLLITRKRLSRLRRHRRDGAPLTP
jgi:4-amino-4-deoxy-L-arabinose transferase-like glycosyltransferase